MKNRYIISFTLILFIGALAITGCNKDDEIGPTVTIASLSPDPVFQGDPVTISGDNLNTVQHVFFNQQEADFTLNGSSLEVTTPLNADVGPNVVTLAMKNNYRVTGSITVELIPTPVIQSFDAWVPIGEELLITGTSLDNNTVVTIDGTEASIKSNTGTEMVVTVPAGIPDDRPLEVEITTSYGSTTTPTPFFARENLLYNGQLELGSGDEFDGWEKLNGGDGMTEVTGEDAFGGGRSMRVVGAASNPWNTQLASTPVQLDYQAEYTIIFYAKAEAEGAVMRVSQSQYDGNGADYFYGPDTELATEWKGYSFTLTVGKDLPEHRTVFDMGATNVPFLIDHMALVPGRVDLSGVTGEAPEQLTNGGFEDGLASWELLNGTIELTTEDVHCGAQAIKITPGGGNPWDQQMAADAIPLIFENQYEIRLWAKGAGPGAVMRVSCSRYNGGNGDDYFYGDDINITEEWAEYKWVFTVGKDIPDGHHLVLDMGAGSQAFYVDDVSLREYREPENILPDGGFENGIYPSGSPDGVASWQLLNGSIEITTNANEVFSGNQAIKITPGGGNPWDQQLAADVVPLVYEGRYGIKLMAKAETAGAVMRVSCSRYNGGNGDDYFYGDDITITEEWAEYSWEFTVGKDIPDGHHLVLDMGAGSEVFFVDDVVLYEIPEFMCP
ncbi:MAG: carbohydrate binding domain-containing protein [Lewinellaceae bacterium]|nr:carbohydrate binding domain-containing protein [Lewinellaceae bacterium]